jgi:protein-S-isoprenylcysteine O-methyltransferase Ste14
MANVPEGGAPKHAGVIAPPPLMLLAALLAGFGLEHVAPLGVLDEAPQSARWIVGGLFIAIALGVNFQGFFRFQRAGTPVRPWMGTTKLVTDGIYAHVRNPMYLGMVLIAFGTGAIFAGDWLIICGALFWLMLHYGVVRREERYLEILFGEEYRQYKKRVPPYGWRF